jgi:hypothetical protein
MTHSNVTQPTEAMLAKAVAGGATPATIEAVLGKPALINTTDPRDRMAVQGANIRPDPRFQPGFPPLAEAENVVYWKVEDTPEDVVVVGVYWLKGGPGVVFRGLIGPPR